jgi:hypothetical protein
MYRVYQHVQISLASFRVYDSSVLCTGISYQTGFFLEYLLGTVTHWRTVAMINAVFPVVTVIYFSQVGA